MSPDISPRAQNRVLYFAPMLIRHRSKPEDEENDALQSRVSHYRKRDMRKLRKILGNFTPKLDNL